MDSGPSLDWVFLRRPSLQNCVNSATAIHLHLRRTSNNIISTLQSSTDRHFFFDLPTFLQVAIFVWTYGKSPAAAFTLWMLFRKTHPVLWAPLLPSVPSTHHHPSPLTLPLQAWNLSFPQILPTVAFFFFFSSSFLAVSRGKSGCKLPAKFFFVFLLLGDKCSVFNSL